MGTKSRCLDLDKSSSVLEQWSTGISRCCTASQSSFAVCCTRFHFVFSMYVRDITNQIFLSPVAYIVKEAFFHSCGFLARWLHGIGTISGGSTNILFDCMSASDQTLDGCIVMQEWNIRRRKTQEAKGKHDGHGLSRFNSGIMVEQDNAPGVIFAPRREFQKHGNFEKINCFSQRPRGST